MYILAGTNMHSVHNVYDHYVQNTISEFLETNFHTKNGTLKNLGLERPLVTDLFFEYSYPETLQLDRK